MACSDSKKYNKEGQMQKIILFMLIMVNISISYAETFKAYVIKVYDGDTVTVEVAGQKERIRLLNIDAPELKQAYGTHSRDALKSYVFNRTVTIEFEGRDRYGRILGTISINNKNVNYLMVLNGHAWVYRKYLHDDAFIAAEDFARKHKAGLWKNNNAIQPEVYRDMYK